MNPVGLVNAVVADVMNGQQLDRLEELCDARLALKLRAAFEQFRAT